jgi:putative heme transporter
MTVDSEPTEPRRRLAPLWTDGFGSVATRSLQVMIVLALAAVVVLGGLQLKIVVIAVLLALILAAAFSPITRLLVRLHLPNLLAALLTLLIVIAVLGGVLTFVAFQVAAQWADLTDAVTQGVQQVEKFAAGFGLTLDSSQVKSAIDGAGDYLTSSSFGSTALSGISAAGNFATAVVLLVVVLFFFLRDGRMIWTFLMRPLQGEAHARAERIGDSTIRVLGAYVRGTALVALVILQVPLALPLSVLVFVTAFIPVVGATLAGIVAALVALVFNDLPTALIVVGIVVLVNQLEGNLLQPVIMGRSLSLHPLVILLALTAGTILGGVLGAILSTPTASVVWTAIKAWKGPDGPADDIPVEQVPASGHGS